MDHAPESASPTEIPEGNIPADEARVATAMPHDPGQQKDAASIELEDGVKVEVPEAKTDDVANEQTTAHSKARRKWDSRAAGRQTTRDAMVAKEELFRERLGEVERDVAKAMGETVGRDVPVP